MPNELRYQSLVIKAVREHGGFGFKLSNKFLVGVPDLFIYLNIASIYEVKSTKLLSMDRWYAERLDRQVKVALSPLQKKFLSELSDCGGNCGVISFIEGKKDTYITALPYKVVAYEDQYIPSFTISSLAYKKLERGRREGIIIETLGGANGTTG